MKILLVLLAFVAATTAVDASPQRSISSQVVEYIEKFQKQMPCGFPRLGLGPLSPARLSHREIALNSDDDGLAFAGEIDNFILYGLDNFDIVQFKINVILSKITFQFHWHRVQFVTDYKMNMNTGNRINLGRNGGARFAIEDLVVVGSAKYSMLSKLRLKELKVSATIGNVFSEIENLSKMKIVNRKLNEIIEEWILLAVNENTKEMEDMSNKHLVPLVNDMIGDATLSDLLGLILGNGSGGSGGGNGSGGGGFVASEEDECIPPEIYV